jgi:hypothetical protein
MSDIHKALRLSLASARMLVQHGIAVLEAGIIPPELTQAVSAIESVESALYEIHEHEPDPSISDGELAAILGVSND